MPTRRTLSWSLVAILVVALAGVWSCSKSSSPTSPGGGGTAKELDSGDISPSTSFQHRFSTAGSFPYHCIHHAIMTGTVVVSASAADTLVAVAINSIAPFPAASVKPGGRVVWTNNTIMLHTVTSD
jgi:plastocyanin